MPTVRLRTRIAISTFVMLVTVLFALYWMVRLAVVRAVRDAEVAVESAEVALRHAVAADQSAIAQAAAALAASDAFMQPSSMRPGEPATAAYGVQWVLLAERSGGHWTTRAWSGTGVEIDPAVLALDACLTEDSPLLRPGPTGRAQAGLVVSAGRLMWVGVARPLPSDGPHERVLLAGMPMTDAPGVLRLRQREQAVRFSLHMRKPAARVRPEGPGRRVRPAAPLGESVVLEPGGAWHLGTAPHRVLVALQDVFGTVVGSLVVELSPLYHQAAGAILDRLVLTLPLGGMALTLLVFLVQTAGVSRPVAGRIGALARIASRQAPPEDAAVRAQDEFGDLSRQVTDLLHDLSRLRAMAHEHQQTRAAMLNLASELVCTFHTDGTLDDVLSPPSILPSLQRCLTPGETLEACGLQRASTATFATGLRRAARQASVECVEILVPACRDTPALRIECRMHPLPLSGDRVLVAFRPVDGSLASGAADADALARREQQNRHEALVRLVAGIAHDFNNLLLVLQSSLDTHMVQHGAENSAPELVAIAQAAKHAEELIRQLQVYAGIADTRFEPVDVGSLLRSKWPLLRASVPHHIELGMELGQPLPDVLADSTQILQVVSNLLRNAAEAIGETPGRIQVAARLLRRDELAPERCLSAAPLDAPHYLALSVTDTGQGIAPSRLGRILEPFYSTKGEGRGLGLAMVDGILESHGGGLRVISNLGEGTTFTLYLPVAGGDAAELPRADAPGTTRRRPRCVLVVEDDARVRHVTRLLLESLGCAVREARDGREARQALQKYAARIDFVLMDANVRGLDGVATLKRIRREHPGLPVLLASGDGEAGVRRVYAGLDFEGFVAKPFRRDAMAAALAAVRAHAGPGAKS